MPCGPEDDARDWIDDVLREAGWAVQDPDTCDPGVAEQSQKYATSDPKHIPPAKSPLPFVYESTGVETNFRDLRDPEPRAREIFHFHQPETLTDWIGQAETLRARLQHMPPFQHGTLRDCQYESIENLEMSRCP